MKLKRSALLYSVIGFVMFSCINNKSEYTKSEQKIVTSQINISKKKRTVAASNLNLSGDYIQKNKPEFASLINQALEIKTAKQLYNFIKTQDQNYDKFKELESKYFVLQLSLLLPAKGIFWRIDTLTASYLGDGRIDTTNTAQNLFVALISRMSSFNTVFAGFSSENNWKAGYDFLTKPNDEFTFEKVLTSKSCNIKKYKKFGLSFNNEKDYRAYLACEYYPALVKAEERLKTLLNDPQIKMMENSNKFLVWDNKLLYGVDSFDPEKGQDADRIRKITGGDIYSVMAGIQSAKSGIESSIAYKLKGLVAIINKAGKVMASVGISTKKISKESFSSRKRTRIINGERNFLRAEKTNFYGGDYRYWMKKSLTSVESWWKYADRARVIYENTSDFFEKDDSQLILNPALINFVQRSLDLSDEHIKNMIFEDEAIISSIVGKTLRINYRNIFLSPVTDIKVYLPNRWKGKENDVRRSYRSKKLKSRIYYRDFSVGNSDGWNVETYRKIFPEVKSKDDLREAARIMSQSWGGVPGVLILNQIFL